MSSKLHMGLPFFVYKKKKIKKNNQHLALEIKL